MDGKRVLVTGGAGFIGSNLANHLADRNEVVVVDDCYLGDPTNLDDAVAFHEASVLDPDLPTDVVVVVHLAALSSYAMHEDDPTRGPRVNVEGFVNTVEQARDDGCDRVVYASTSSIYGSRTEPSPEDLPVTVNTGYEASKLARERYAEYFHNHYGMDLAGLRFFSVYQGYGGGGPQGRVRQRHRPVRRRRGERPPARPLRRRHPDPRLHPRRGRGPRRRARRGRTARRRLQRRHRGALQLRDGRRDDQRGARHPGRPDLRRESHPRLGVRPRHLRGRVEAAGGTGWEPAVDFETGIERVCAQYR